MIQYTRFQHLFPGTGDPTPNAVTLDQNNYQTRIAGNLPSGVFDFQWFVIENHNGKAANVTLVNRKHTWNGVPLEKVRETIIAAYEKEIPCAIGIVGFRLQNDPFDGIGLGVEHCLMNKHGECPDYCDNMYEDVLRVDVDKYRLSVMALNGRWSDHHRFPTNDSFEVGTRTAYQYWSTVAGRVPNSGYTITRTVEEVAPDQRRVSIMKFPTIVHIEGTSAAPAFGGGASIKFNVRRSEQKWILLE